MIRVPVDDGDEFSRTIITGIPSSFLMVNGPVSGSDVKRSHGTELKCAVVSKVLIC